MSDDKCIEGFINDLFLPRFVYRKGKIYEIENYIKEDHSIKFFYKEVTFSELPLLPQLLFNEKHGTQMLKMEDCRLNGNNNRCESLELIYKLINVQEALSERSNELYPINSLD